MKCMHCGADLPEDQLICPSCGREIQIVPDYNPLDDMLTAQLKGGITQTMSLHLGEQEKQDVSYSGAANPVYERRESVGGETRCVGNSGSVGRRQQETVTRRGRDAVVRRSDVRPATGRVGQREDAREQTRRAYEEERRLRRMRAEKRKEQRQKKTGPENAAYATGGVYCSGRTHFLVLSKFIYRKSKERIPASGSFRI